MYSSTFKHSWRPESHIKIPQWVRHHLLPPRKQESERSPPQGQTDTQTDRYANNQINKYPKINKSFTSGALGPQINPFHHVREETLSKTRHKIRSFGKKSTFHIHLCTFPSLGSEFCGFGTDLWLLMSYVHCDRAEKSYRVTASASSLSHHWCLSEERVKKKTKKKTDQVWWQ